MCYQKRGWGVIGPAKKTWISTTLKLNCNDNDAESATMTRRSQMKWARMCIT